MAFTHAHLLNKWNSLLPHVALLKCYNYYFDYDYTTLGWTRSKRYFVFLQFSPRIFSQGARETLSEAYSMYSLFCRKTEQKGVPAEMEIYEDLDFLTIANHWKITIKLMSREVKFFLFIILQYRSNATLTPICVWWDFKAGWVQKICKI